MEQEGVDMQEVFEKIIEELEENQTIVFNLGGGKP